MSVPLRRAAFWTGAMLLIAVVTAIGSFLRLNPNTVGFVYLVAVLLISVWGGLLLGTVSSIIATLCYNFFFFPPLHTFNIEQPANWFALTAFLVSSVMVNRLVVASKLQATLALERARFIEETAHLEALQESEALKTSLLRAISHDLTTPITAISIRIDSLRRRASDAEALDDIRAIAEQTARLRRRIENLLSMASLEAGKARAHPEPTPPADLFRAARENLPLVFETRPVTIHVDADCPDANVDPSLALEILVNLIENAHRVSPPRAPMELVAGRHPTNMGRIRLEILDRGPGLPVGVDGASSITNSDAGQRGLGLEIARGLAAANDGTVVLEPRDGGGTIARVDVPAAGLTAGLTMEET